ncbi:uncharacterized protein DS421_12g368480 [Arachis hypogaea]|nr:uncharacterized protein DS421_12g368480 [Arachis hypogaea]
MAKIPDGAGTRGDLPVTGRIWGRFVPARMGDGVPLSPSPLALSEPHTVAPSPPPTAISHPCSPSPLRRYLHPLSPSPPPLTHCGVEVNQVTITSRTPQQGVRHLHRYRVFAGCHLFSSCRAFAGCHLFAIE